jgi:hypothetical protein
VAETSLEGSPRRRGSRTRAGTSFGRPEGPGTEPDSELLTAWRTLANALWKLADVLDRRSEGKGAPVEWELREPATDAERSAWAELTHPKPAEAIRRVVERGIRRETKPFFARALAASEGARRP